MTQAHLIERLSAQDLAALWWTVPAGRATSGRWPWSMEPGGGPGWPVPDRGCPPGDRAAPASVPRFRQLLYRPPRGLGWPLWADAASFELADHIRVFPLPPPGDHAHFCWRVRSCAAGGWIPHAHYGRCGSCPACRGAAACSCGCITPWPMGWPAWRPSARFSTSPPPRPGQPRSPDTGAVRRQASSCPTMCADAPTGSATC